jgi:hypothetical protein
MSLSPLQKALKAADKGGSVTLDAADAAKLARLLMLLLEKHPMPSDLPTMDPAALGRDPLVAAAANLRRLR